MSRHHAIKKSTEGAFLSVVVISIKAVDDIKEVAVPKKKHPPHTKTAAGIVCHEKTPKQSGIRSFNSKRARKSPGESCADAKSQRVANKTYFLFAVKVTSFSEN